LFFSYLDAFILTFVVVGSLITPVIALTDSGMKDLRHGGDHADKQVITWDPLVQVETVHTREASVVYVSLVSGQRPKAVNRGTIYGLLANCLLDV
jgi:hypothetical protein